jgi:hypothetical protein
MRRKVRLSRELDLSARQFTLAHRPTGISVDGEIPPGHYSRIEMIRLKEKLPDRLFYELEDEVGKKLRLPGRTKR